jgi:hypothetical protein
MRSQDEDRQATVLSKERFEQVETKNEVCDRWWMYNERGKEEKKSIEVVNGR